jgi:hypothetical protein
MDRNKYSMRGDIEDRMLKEFNSIHGDENRPKSGTTFHLVFPFAHHGLFGETVAITKLMYFGLRYFSTIHIFHQRLRLITIRIRFSPYDHLVVHLKYSSRISPISTMTQFKAWITKLQMQIGIKISVFSYDTYDALINEMDDLVTRLGSKGSHNILAYTVTRETSIKERWMKKLKDTLHGSCHKSTSIIII